ncbi:MAG TPA: C39 family peptidase [Patescibacteria group bacterium]|nr:C39 family peptidase [Patescibacteria group bacterium]
MGFHNHRRVLLVFTIFLSLFSFSQKSFASEIFSDYFTDVDGVSLINHNNLWQGYTNLSNASILNNSIISIGSNSSYYIPSLSSLSDYCVQADFSYPLVQVQPPTFFDISTRRNSGHDTHHYDAGLTENGTILFLGLDYNNTLFSTSPSLSNGIHSLKLCSIGNDQSLYLDNQLITTVVDNTYSSGAPGFDLGNNAPIDNFIVTSAEAPTPTPLPVPLIKQTDPLWDSQKYDSANKWSPKDPTIGSWGCALTSATMILNYYQIIKLPDSTFITPGTLNKWLIGQKDGYIGNGLVNWLAISRLSKLAKNSGNNPNFQNDALEFDREGANASTQLTSDLQSGHPDILQEPGHFVVAKGITDSTFAINDPYYSYQTLSDGYNNSFNALDRYIPSNTDLSYFLITDDNGSQIDLRDSNNTVIGNSFVETALTNDNNPSQKSGNDINVVLVKKPTSGKYTITISGQPNSIFSSSLYLYDSNGNPLIKKINGFASPDKPSSFSFDYDKDNTNTISVQKIVTFDTLINDINSAISMKKINKALGESLILTVTSANTTYPKNKKLGIKILKTGQTILKSTKKSLIENDAAAILTEDFSTLIKAL